MHACVCVCVRTRVCVHACSGAGYQNDFVGTDSQEEQYRLKLWMLLLFDLSEYRGWWGDLTHSWTYTQTVQQS